MNTATSNIFDTPVTATHQMAYDFLMSFREGTGDLTVPLDHTPSPYDGRGTEFPATREQGQGSSQPTEM